jgi:penicillin amidase
VYADVDGDIGWVAAALTPVRKGFDGLLPVPGWTNRHAWTGFLPVSELPQSFNPARRWLATANHNIVPEGYPHRIAHEWAPPHRYLRVAQRLEANKQFTLEDFQSIQHEATSLPGQELEKLLGGVKFGDPRITRLARQFTAWDGVLSRDTSMGPLYAVWLQELTRQFYARAALDKEATEALRQVNNIAHLLRELQLPARDWFGDHAEAARDQLLHDTFTQAVTRTETLLGRDEATWRWGKLHTVTFRHALAKHGKAHEQAFNLGPVERTGDGNTPNNTRHDDNFNQLHGASYRHLFDLADWDRSLATSAPGQSGQLGSPHYGDLLPLWAEGQYFPLVYSRRKVEEDTRHRLLLAPR